MKWKVIKTEGNEIHAGWETPDPRPGAPARVDGWSLWFKLDEIENDCVKGRIEFPERGFFEFDGSIEKMLKVIKEHEGGRAIFSAPGFEFWRR